MYTTVVVQWDIYMQYGRNICSEAHASHVKCMYTSVPSHIIDNDEFMWGLYTLTLLSPIFTWTNLHVWHTFLIWGFFFVGIYMAITHELSIAVSHIIAYVCQNIRSIHLWNIMAMWQPYLFSGTCYTYKHINTYLHTCLPTTHEISDFNFSRSSVFPELQDYRNPGILENTAFWNYVCFRQTLCMDVSICLSVYLSIIYVCLYVFFYAYLSIYLYIHLSIWLPS